MPRKVSKDDPTRLYNSDFMERITRAHPAEPFVIFVPAVLAMMTYVFITSEQLWLTSLVIAFGGFSLWTLSEYGLHRYLFHYEPTSEFGKRQMKLIHGIHHQFPSDTDRLVIPPAVGVFVAVGFMALFWAIGGAEIGFPLWAGYITGYMHYDFVHYSTHHRNMKTAIGRAQRRRHLIHHFKYPNACYGVSTGVWDWVFRTRECDAKEQGQREKPLGVWQVVSTKRE